MNQTVDVKDYRTSQPRAIGALDVGLFTEPDIIDTEVEQDRTNENQIKALKEELEEQKAVINQLIDQLTEKTLEIADMKGHMSEAFKETAKAKCDLATTKLENEQLSFFVEQLRQKIGTERKLR